jgi:hypothetical protein
MSNVQHNCSVTSFAEIAIKLARTDHRPNDCTPTYDNGHGIQFYNLDLHIYGKTGLLYAKIT